MLKAILSLIPFVIIAVTALALHERAIKANRKEKRRRERRDRHKEERREQAKKDTDKMAVLANYYGGINNVK